ncbi:unnamed protein product [marine sediment metagenome]|uniref:Uncharacterized protein n=1 Tax=marine sediment metagenome TaxID=412755 RepID=X1RT41_9ZZZZ
MPIIDSSSEKSEIIEALNDLLLKYRELTENGVVFKLKKDKSPLELLGVLDFLKDKIKRWGNDDIFTYCANLFEDFNIITIGAENIEKAKELIISVFLSDLIKNEDEGGLDIIFKNVKTFNQFEEWLKIEISKGISNDYPPDPEKAKELKKHLETILKEV